MTTLVILVLFSLLPINKVQYAQTIEDNYCYRCDGFDPVAGPVWELQYHQLIFWDEAPYENVKEFILLKDDEEVNVEENTRQPFVQIGGRVIKCESFIRSTTFYDPERDAARTIDEKFRRKVR